MKNSQRKSGADLIARLDAALPGRLLAFGLIYAWSTCLWDIPVAGIGDDPLQTGQAWLLSAVLTPLACFAAALIGRRRSFTAMRWLYGVAPLLCSLGTVAVIALPWVDNPLLTAVLVAIGGIGTGVGPAVLIILWICLFARLETELVEMVVPASFGATLLCALIVPALPGPLAQVILVALPLLSGAGLLLSRNSYERGLLPLANRRDEGTAPDSRRHWISLFLAVFALYTLGCAPPSLAVCTIPAVLEAAATIVGMLFAIGLSVGVVLFARRINLATLYRAITVPFVIAVVAFAITGEVAGFTARVAMNMVFTGIEIIIVLSVIRLGRQNSHSVAFFSGLGEGAAYSGVLAGYTIQPLLASLVRSPAEATFGCLVVLGLFALTSLMVPTQNRLLVPPYGANDAGVSEGDTASAAPETPVSPSAPRAASEIPASDSATAVSSGTVPPGIAPPVAPEAERGAIAARRREIAQAHGLTNRETDIFLLLAQGRSRPYIRDALYLSKNTVATHIRHIYEKLGIHSQQELIDLVEA